MSDQAEQLRTCLRDKDVGRTAKIMAIASGKGGVGKSNFTINFAIKLKEHGKKVLLIDFDIGMGNIDILLGVVPQGTIVDLFTQSITIEELIEIGPGDIAYISGGSGLSEIFNLNEERSACFSQQFKKLVHTYDFILFDMGAGITMDSLYFMVSADESIIITTPEPTSITDAYAVIKHLCYFDHGLPIQMVINRVMAKGTAEDTFLRMQKAAMRFLNKELTLLGSLPDDPKVMQSVLDQIPFVIKEQMCPASKAMNRMVEKYLNIPVKTNSPASFLAKLKSFVTER